MSLTAEQIGERAWRTTLRIPYRLLGIALLLWAAVLLVTIRLATHQPWPGIVVTPSVAQGGFAVTRVWPDGPAAGKLAPGDVITGLAPGDGAFLQITPDDLLVDPDHLPTFARLNAFLQRQDRLFAALSAPVTRMQTRDGREIAIRHRPQRPLAALPAAFWAFQFYGVVALLVGSWIRVASGAKRPAALMLGSALGFLLLCAAASIITTRGMALPGEEMRRLLAVYHFGNNVFSLFLAALFWSYPVRLGARSMFGVLLVWVSWAWLNERFQWHDLPGHNTGFQVAILLTVGGVLLAAQWWASRHRPADRVVVRFFLLAIAGTLVLALVLYYGRIWGFAGGQVSLVAALGLALIMYVALAIGTARYRLFDVDRCWAQLWLWLGAGVAILGMDAGFSLLFPRLSHYSLVVALLFVGWIYFPLRQWLWNKTFPEHGIALMADLWPDFILHVLSRREDGAERAWRDLLQRTFVPLEIVQASRRSERPAIRDHGERLYVPGLRNDGYVLCHAHRGRRLFDSRDLEVVAAVHRVACLLDSQIAEHRRGVQQERERIMRDLHDDVGGRLLTLVHECDRRRAGRIAREALDALREVIHFSTDPKAVVPLPNAIGRWRNQLRERLQQQQVTLQWSWEADAMAGCTMAAMDVLNLGRILQEAVSNALRHAQPSCIRVNGACHAGHLVVTIVNDGVEPDAGSRDTVPGGKGIPNMQRRAGEMGGELSVDFSGDTCQVVLRVPLADCGEKDDVVCADR